MKSTRPLRLARHILWIGCLTIVIFSTVRADSSGARDTVSGTYSPAQHEITESRNALVAMRDGVRLSVDIYAPRLPGRLPSILTITPFDSAISMRDARSLAQRGYIVVVADSRGRYDSEGEFDPFDVRHKNDGYDLVEWMASQSWSNGKIGMIGASYMAWTQWWTASLSPAHLVTIVPKVAPPDAFYNIPYQQGVLTGDWFFAWGALVTGRTLKTVDRGPYGGWLMRNEDLKHTPYIGINAFRGMRNAPWFETMYRHNKSTDLYWKAIAYQSKESYSRVTVPSLAFSGWFDANHPGTPMNYLGMKRFGNTPAARRPVMIIGPWTHELKTPVIGNVSYGPEADFDVEDYIARWLDHFLKGIDNGIEKDPPVRVFVMGENRWYVAEDWPLPQAVPTKYYLTSGGRANSLKGDGVLTTAAPNTDGLDMYSYDPRNPTQDAFVDHPDHVNLDGPADTRLSAIGDDVLVYETPPLQSPVKVIGPIEAILYAETSARDTDWFVRLVDVQPNGRSLLLCEGAIRARNRDASNSGRFNPAQLSVIEPGKIYQYTIEFWRGTANLFDRGHRIRVEISSSWSPYYLPNLNTGADNLALVSMSDAVVARQTLHHGSKYPSHILLPVVASKSAALQ